MGVLRRMAELDLLRYVEALSTVSGGSILGALYLLVLKSDLDKAAGGRLSRDEYVQVTKKTEALLIRAVQKTLRTRLFMNPLGMLRVLLTPQSLGKRMARFYERYLFQPIAKNLVDQSKWTAWFTPGRLFMKDLRMTPGGKEVTGGIEAYNAGQTAEGGSAITHLIINATSLNSGARFWYSHTEMGDWYL